MSKYLIFLFVALFQEIGYSQIVKIIDKDTGETLPFVNIKCQENNNYVTTNVGGEASLEELADCSNLIISYLGYGTLNLGMEEINSETAIIELSNAGLALNEVVVSATKWKQSSDNIPAKIISISPKEISFQNPQTAADLLSLSGKVFIQKSQQGGGSPMIRGFATNRLLYSVDGIRMNTAIFRGGNIQNVINLDPFAVENVEVVFGPGSVTYGSDAIGGVMSFQTIKPQFTLHDKLNLTGKAISRFSTANQEKTGHVHFNVGGKKLASATSLSFWNYNHLRQGSNGPDDYIKDYYVERQGNEDIVVRQENPLLQVPSAYDQFNVLQKFRYKINDHLELDYGFHFSRTSSYGRYDRHNRVRNGTARYAEWDYGPQSWMMHMLAANYKKTTILMDENYVRIAYQQFGESRISRNLNNKNRDIQTEQVDAYSFNWDFVKGLSERHLIYYGTEYVLNKVKSTGLITNIIENTSIEGPSRYPAADWITYGIYVQDEFKVNDKLSMLSGIRYSRFSLNAQFNTDLFPLPFDEASLNNGSLTGSIGTVIRPNETTVINMNLGTAYRAPNVDDVGKVFDSEPGAVTVPNPDIQSEYAYNADLGMTKIFNEKLKVDLTFYFTYLDNALVRRNFQLNNQDSILYEGFLSQVQAIQNAAFARIFGVQAGIEYNYSNHWRLRSDYNLQHGREVLDDGSISPSRHAAPSFGNTRIEYKHKKWVVQLYALYQAGIKHEMMPDEEKGKDEIYALDENGNTYAPSWYTINLKSSYRLNQHFNINLGFENLTDQRYRPFSSGISGAGRNVVLSITASW